MTGVRRQLHAVCAAASLYVREFYRKGLFRFEPCQRHYRAMGSEELLADAEWLCGEATRMLPYPLVFRRYYALFEALTERAVCEMRLSRARRMRLINAAIATKETMRKRAPAVTREQLTRLLRDSCTRLGKAGCHPEACVLIPDRTGPVSPRAAVVHPGSLAVQ